MATNIFKLSRDSPFDQVRRTDEKPPTKWWVFVGWGGFPGGSDDKASACNAGDLGSIPGLGRSPGEENGNPLQYSCLENPMDRGAWWATAHGVAKSWTRLSDFTHTHIVDVCMFDGGSVCMCGVCVCPSVCVGQSSQPRIKRALHQALTWLWSEQCLTCERFTYIISKLHKDPTGVLYKWGQWVLERWRVVTCPRSHSQ